MSIRTRGASVLEALLLTVIAVSLAAIAWSLIGRDGGEQPRQSLTASPGWQTLLKAAVPGDSVELIQPPVTVAVFSDLECPFCRSFHEVLRELQADFPDRIALAFIHLPLSIHPQAIPAARAVECAAENRRAAAMIDVIFANQGRLGTSSWDSLASRAGVERLSAFHSCVRNDETPRRVAEGKRLADSIGVPGTPTVFVNEWRFAYPPTRAELEKVVGAVLAGGRPKL